MSNIPFPLDEFHQKLHVISSSRPTRDRLELLQRSFIYSIPFENFDVQLSRKINLKTSALIDKILRKNRGGYCFELNALFMSALQTEGFSVRPILSRVHLHGPPTARTHQALLVTIEGKDWLVDVGFGGGCPRVPMQLNDAASTNHDGTILKLVKHHLGTLVQRQTPDGQWQDLYSFDLMPVLQSDIEMANYFTATHPESPFVNMRMAVKSYVEGETRLLDFSCTKIENGIVNQVTNLPDSAEYLSMLKNHMGIELNTAYSQLLPLANTYSTNNNAN